MGRMRFSLWEAPHCVLVSWEWSRMWLHPYLRAAQTNSHSVPVTPVEFLRWPRCPRSESGISAKIPPAGGFGRPPSHSQALHKSLEARTRPRPAACERES